MKIATWNIERPKQKKLLNEIIIACDCIQADILVLTETDEQVRPNYAYSFQTPTPLKMEMSHYEDSLQYKPTEHRT